MLVLGTKLQLSGIHSRDLIYRVIVVNNIASYTENLLRV